MRSGRYNGRPYRKRRRGWLKDGAAYLGSRSRETSKQLGVCENGGKLLNDRGQNGTSGTSVAKLRGRVVVAVVSAVKGR